MGGGGRVVVPDDLQKAVDGLGRSRSGKRHDLGERLRAAPGVPGLAGLEALLPQSFSRVVVNRELGASLALGGHGPLGCNSQLYCRIFGLQRSRGATIFYVRTQEDEMIHAAKKPRRPYNVEVRYFTPIANYQLRVMAFSKINALWVAAETLSQRGDTAYASIGKIERAAA